MADIEIGSRFAIGDLALFCPNVFKIDDKEDTCDAEASVLCQIVGVSACDGKILYDIAVQDGGDPDGNISFYTVWPMRDVDSFMIRPAHPNWSETTKSASI